MPIPIYPAEGFGAHIKSVRTLAEVVENSQVENLEIERLIDGESLAASQEPTGTGDANAIRVEFGPAVNPGPVSIDATGRLTIHEAGLYRIKIALQFGRTGASGTSILMFRVVVNGTQVGRSVSQKLSSSTATGYFENDTWIGLPSGATLDFEVTRDPAGSNSGGLFQTVASGSWNDAPSAALRVERYRGVL
jgi:hypothetical protein